MKSRSLGLVVACLISLTTVEAASGATHRTRNFFVKAIRADIARQVAEYAEHYRRTKAIEWLGEEMPDWSQPCQIDVVVKNGDAGGATSFAFDRGRVLGQDMTVEGPLERILNSVLPHEITHTVFAAKFGRPLPRWADEGGAVLSEDASELDRHDRLCREIINTGRMIPLSRLMLLTEYPNDVMALYAQGFSVANYLASIKGKPYFLDFVYDGQSVGWNAALASYYGIYSADDLERRWIQWLRQGRGTGADHILYAAQTTPGSSTTSARAMMPRGEMPTDPWTQKPVAVSRPTAPAPNAGRPLFEPVLVNQVAASSPSANPAAGHSWMGLPNAATAQPTGQTGPTGQTTVSSALNGPTVESSEQFRPRRLMPIAVGRTRRDSAP